MPGSDRPTILHVIHSLEGGGTERTLVRLLTQLDPAICRHVVVTLRQAGSLAHTLPNHAACRALGESTDARCLGLALAAIAREEHAAAIHARNTCCWADATIAKLLTPRIRLVLGFHGLERRGNFMCRDRVVARMATCIGARFSTPSISAADKLVRELGIPRNRVQTLLNGVDIADDPPHGGGAWRSARARWNLTDSETVIGAVGALSPVKRHDLLVEAFARVRTRCPDAHLLLVGDGPLRAAIQHQCRTLRVHEAVTITGWLDNVAAALQAMDVYVCPSDSEGMSNAVLEALAAGLPVVATDVGDNPIVIRPDQDGLVVPPDDANALASALLDLVETSGRRTQLSQAANRRARRYSFRKTVRAYDTYYRALTTARSTRLL